MATATTAQSLPDKVWAGTTPLGKWVDVIILNAVNSYTASYTAPDNAKFAVIAANNPVYVKSGGTAAVPVAAIVDGSGSQYVSVGLQVRLESSSTVGFIAASSTDTIVTITVYR